MCATRASVAIGVINQQVALWITTVAIHLLCQRKEAKKKGEIHIGSGNAGPKNASARLWFCSKHALHKCHKFVFTLITKMAFEFCILRCFNGVKQDAYESHNLIIHLPAVRRAKLDATGRVLFFFFFWFRFRFYGWSRRRALYIRVQV